MLGSLPAARFLGRERDAKAARNRGFASRAAGFSTLRMTWEKQLIGWFSLTFSYHVPYIYLTDWAKTQGQPKDEDLIDEFLNNVPSGGRQSEEPSFLLSIVGILNTLGVVRTTHIYTYTSLHGAKFG